MLVNDNRRTFELVNPYGEHGNPYQYTTFKVDEKFDMDSLLSWATRFNHFDTISAFINAYTKEELAQFKIVGQDEHEGIGNTHSVMLEAELYNGNFIVIIHNTSIDAVQSALDIYGRPAEEAAEMTESIISEPKHKLKTKVKFIVGDKYKLVYKIKGCAKNFEKTFVCKQKMYYINEKEVNCVVMKQLTGPVSNKYCLNKHDCKLYHIKYEPGLEVFSMNLNWKKCITKKQ